MDRQEYRYERIDRETNAFRLLRIPRGYYGSPMRCEIFQSYVDRDLGVPYEALSYTWGDTSIPTIPIDIVGNESMSTTSYLNIYPNLHEILQHLRRDNEDRIIWIDAICIDQSHQKESLRERTHQVEQMRLVYERADSVIAWLGSLDCIQSISWDGMAMLAEASNELGRVPIVESTRTPGTRAWSLARQALIKNRSQGEIHNMCAAVEHLLGQPYFTRVWIIQEVASARSGLVVCGDGGITVSIPMRLFMLMPSLLGIHPERHVQAILDVMPMSYQRRTGWWNEKNNLGTLLAKFQDSKCTDPRDSVYALLGISSDPGLLQALRPDYGLSVERVFKNTLLWLLFGFSEAVESNQAVENDQRKDPIASLLLPDETFWIQDADNIATLSHKILIWALERGESSTAACLLKYGNIKTDHKVMPEPQTRTSLMFRMERGPQVMVEKILAGVVDNMAPGDALTMSAPIRQAATIGQVLKTFRLVLSPQVTQNCVGWYSEAAWDKWLGWRERQTRLPAPPGTHNRLQVNIDSSAAEFADMDELSLERTDELAQGVEVGLPPEVIQLLLCEPDAIGYPTLTNGQEALKRALEKGYLDEVGNFLDLPFDAYLLWQVASGWTNSRCSACGRVFPTHDEVGITNIGEQVTGFKGLHVAIIDRGCDGRVELLLQPEDMIVDPTSKGYHTRIWTAFHFDLGRCYGPVAKVHAHVPDPGTSEDLAQARQEQAQFFSLIKASWWFAAVWNWLILYLESFI